MVEWKNWKTVDNVNDYNGVSDDSILKRDSHRAEIVDITTGVVVDYDPISDENRFTENQKIIRNRIGDCFCSTDWSKH